MPYKDKEQQKLAQQTHYINNLDKYAKSRSDNKARRHKFVQELKEASPCLDCGIHYPYYVMQFDHRDSKEKAYSISWMLNRFSLDTIKEEIEKCDLVCGNCHAIRSHRRKMDLDLQKDPR